MIIDNEMDSEFTVKPSQRYFLVSLHDVAAPFLKDILTILGNITTRVGSDISLAVTLNWHSEQALDSKSIAQIRERVEGDLLVHGMSHYRYCGYGVVSWLTKRSDEFNGLSSNEALILAQQARNQIEDRFGVFVSGFVPPAWQFGALTVEDLTNVGFKFAISYGGIHSKSRSIRLANYTWDNGSLCLLGYVGHFLGKLSSLLQGRMPCITFHPRDVASGFDKVGYRLIDQLMTMGYLPIKPSKLMEDYENST